MRECRIGFAAVLVLVLAGGAPCFGHVGVDERIESLGDRIAHDPKNAELYLDRAELHRSHQHWDEALADYRKAQELLTGSSDDAEYQKVPFYMGRLWQERGRPQKALPLLNAFLAKFPEHGGALESRAKAYYDAGMPLSAARDMDTLIKLKKKSIPQYYLDKTKYLLGAGPGYHDWAMAAIDDGIARSGPLVTLIHFAVVTERKHGRYDQALAYIEQLPDSLRNLPEWLVRRADILYDAGRPEAAEAYRATLDAIKRLPPRVQNRKAIRQLKTRLTSRLAHPPTESETK